MKKKKLSLNHLWVLFFLLSLSTCAVNHGPVYLKEGKKYGVVSGNFTDRWYDYYERGLSYGAGGYYQEALSDLDMAIKKRAADQRWANTYGMHFIDYFPHREKGIIYFLMGNYRLSETELMVSIKDEPSAKAGHFLNQARIKRMIKEKNPVTSPEIQMIHPEGARNEFRNEWVEIKGIASDESYVSDIFIAGEKLWRVSSETKIPFSRHLSLPEGDHPIEIVVRNLLGGETKKTIAITVDRSGPTIIIRDFIPGVTLSGYLADRTAIRSFRVSGREHLSSLKNGVFTIPLNGPPIAPLYLEASDAAGNTTRLKMTAETSALMEESASNLFAAGVWLADVGSHADELSPDPRISMLLHGVLPESVVYKKSIPLQGEIRSPSPIRSFNIALNGAPLAIPLNGQQGGLTPSGGVVSFNQSLSLKEGENTLTIQAETVSGDRGERVWSIIRKIPEIWKPENRYAVKLYPLDEKVRRHERSLVDRVIGSAPILKGFSEFMDAEKRDLLKEMMAEDILKRKRFQLVASDSEALETNDKLKEATATASKGKKNAPHPDGLFIGNSCVDRYGTEVTVRLVTLASFEEIISTDLFCPGETREDLKKMALELSKNIHQSLPVSEGTVAAVSSGKFLVSCTTGEIKKGWPLLVYTDKSSRNDPNDDCPYNGCDSTILGVFTMGGDRSVDVTTPDIHVEKGNQVIAR